MKKTLKIVAIISGLVSLASAVWLACLYMEDILKYIEIAKEKVVKLIAKKVS